MVLSVRHLQILQVNKKLTAKDYQIDKLLSMLNPVNPRQISDDAKSALSEGFYRFGCVEPVIVNLTTGMVVGGHQRITTASESGIKTLPVVELELTPERELALNLALNKTGGTWDFDKLSELVTSIPIEDVFVTGFSVSEIDTIADRYEKDIAALESRSWETVRDDRATAITGSVRKSASVDSSDSSGGKQNLSSQDEDEDIRDFGSERQSDRRSNSGGSIDRSQEIRNRTIDEVTPPRGTDANTLSIYFGLFSTKISVSTYERWVASLRSESDVGDSPTALGLVVAKRLGLAVSSNG